jgi:hypothetical protein
MRARLVPQIAALSGCSPLGLKRAVTSGRVKAAWIRDDVPAGVPAPGRFDCECGRPIRAGYFGQGPDVQCDCGLVYDNQGWIRGRG